MREPMLVLGMGNLKRYWIFYSVLLSFILPFIVPIPNVDVPFIETSINSRDVLVVIVQSLTQTFGVLSALVLIVFQLRRKSFSGIALARILFKGPIKTVAFLYVSSIVFGLMSLLSLRILPNNINLVHTLTASVLFVLCIIVLFPLFLKVFSDTQLESETEQQLKKISLSDIKMLTYEDTFHTQEWYLTELNKNPIIILSGCTLSAFKDGEDDNNIRRIISSVNAWILKEDRMNSAHIRDILAAFLSNFYLPLAQAAATAQSQSIYSAVLDSVFYVAITSASKKLKWHQMTETKEALESLMKEAVKIGFHGIVTKSIYTLEFAMEDQLKNNSPDSSKVWKMYGGESKDPQKSNDSMDIDLQWDHISSSYLTILSNVTREAIRIGDAHSAANGVYAFGSIIEKVMRIEELSDPMKTWVIQHACFDATHLYSSLVDEGLNRKALLSFPFQYHSVTHAVESGSPYVKNILLAYSNTIVIAAKKGSLDRFILNGYVSVGRSLANISKTSSLARQSIVLILSTLDSVRALFHEGRGRQQQLSPGIYSDLYNQVKSIKNFQKATDPTSELIGLVEVNLNKFDKMFIDEEKRQQFTSDWPE